MRSGGVPGSLANSFIVFSFNRSRLIEKLIWYVIIGYEAKVQNPPVGKKPTGKLFSGSRD